MGGQDYIIILYRAGRLKPAPSSGFLETMAYRIIGMGKINFKNRPSGGFAKDPFANTLISVFSVLLAPSKPTAGTTLDGRIDGEA